MSDEPERIHLRKGDADVVFDTELKSWVYTRGAVMVGLVRTFTGEFEFWRGDRLSKTFSWMYPNAVGDDEIAEAFANWCEAGPVGDPPLGWVRSNWCPETGGHQFFRRRRWDAENQVWVETVRP